MCYENRTNPLASDRAPVEGVGEPRLRVDVAQLGGADESVHRNGLLAAALGAREQPGAPYAKPI